MSSTNKVKGQSLDELRDFLNKLSKKGFIHVLFYTEEKGSLHYNDIHKYLVNEKKIVERASVTIIVNGLTSMGLLERTVLTETKPIRTIYRISKKGKSLLHYLRQIEEEIG